MRDRKKLILKMESVIISMKKYIIEIPLHYNKTSNLDKPDSCNDLCLELDKDIIYQLSNPIDKKPFTSEEQCIIKVKNTDENFMIIIDSLYVDNEELAIEASMTLANKICHAITYIVQSQNSNPHYFHPKFTYKARDIVCKEETYEKFDTSLKQDNKGNKTIIINDSVTIREFLNIKMIHCVKTGDFDKVIEFLLDNKHISFIIESFYRALGESDYISKYYNLFTIIEYLESNFQNESGAMKLLSKDQKTALINIIDQKLTECFDNGTDNTNEYLKRLSNRVSQVLSESTDKTRAEKLNTIIRGYLKIDRVNNHLFSYEISESKLKDFINVRNGLFHAKNLSSDELKNIEVLTNELMELCSLIINSLMQINLSNK